MTWHYIAQLEDPVSGFVVAAKECETISEACEYLRMEWIDRAQTADSKRHAIKRYTGHIQSVYVGDGPSD